MKTFTISTRVRTALTLFICSFTLLSFTANATLNGTYTIDATKSASASNYKNFTSAIDDLTIGTRTDGGTANGAGVAGPVIFNVASGKYTEQLVISAVSGASATNSITFQSKVLDSSKVILDYPSSSTNSLADYTVQMNGADYFTFREMSFTRSGANYYSCTLNVQGASCNNTFTNCQFIGVKYYDYNIYSYLDNDTNDHFINNYIHYGAYGIYWTGNYPILETGTLIQGNIIDSSYYYAMDIYYEEGINITQNTIKNCTYAPMVIYYCSDGVKITKNNIYGNITDYGIYLYYCGWFSGTNTNTSQSLMANNMIAITTDTNYSPVGVYDIYNTNFDYYFNNILISGTSTASRAFYHLGYITYNNNNVIGNNFVNKAKGYAYYNTVGASILKSDYNNIYTNGSVFASWDGTSYTSLTALRSGSGLDAKSKNLDPGYTSTTDLHISNTALHDAAKSMPEVTDDFDGQFRSPNVTDIGADMIFTKTNDAGISAVGPTQPYGIGTQSVTARLENFGSNNLTKATVNWKLNGTTKTAYSWTGTLAPGGYTYVTLGSTSVSLGTSTTLKVWSSSPNATTDGDDLNDTMQTITCPGLSGTFTIGGASANYSTFAAAINAMSCGGVAGPVVFKVNKGTYNEQVDIPAIKFTNSTNTVTFDGLDSSKCKIYYSSSSSLSGYTVRLNNAQYIRLKNLTIQAKGTTYANALHVYGACGNDSIFKCSMQVPTASYYYSAYYYSPVLIDNYSDLAYLYSGYAINSNNLEIDSCSIQNGYYGIDAYVSNNFNNRFIGNSITGAYVYGAVLSGFNGIDFTANTIDMNQTLYTGSIGLYLYTGYTSYPNINMVDRNKITHTGLYGMEIYGNGGAVYGKSGEIINNMIGGGFYDTASATGIYLSGSYWKIWYNSVNLDIATSSTTAAASCFNSVSSVSGLDIEDNLFAYTSKTGGGLPMIITNASCISVLDYNNYYKPNPGKALIYIAGNYSPSTYVGGGGFNSNSVSVNPQFVSQYDLHINAPCMNNLGTPLTGSAEALIDFDRDIRSTTTPDMGADEYSPASFDAGVIAITTPTTAVTAGTAYNVVMKVVNFGTNTITALNVNYKLNGNTPVRRKLTGLSLHPCDTLVVTFNATSGAGSKDQRVTFSGGLSVLKAYTDTINTSTADGKHSNDTTRMDVCTLLSGTYTINPASPASLTNFKTFDSAVVALKNCGIKAPVIFNVSNGTYNDRVLIPFINGVSSTNTITFQSLSGDSSKVILTSPSKTTSDSNFTLTLDSSQYIIFKKITIARSGTNQYGISVLLWNGSSNNTFTNNRILGTVTSAITGDAIVFLTASGDSNNLIKNNLIRFGSSGIAITGNSSYPGSNIIDGNTLDSNNYYAVAIDSSTAPIVRNNTIQNLVNTNARGIALINNKGAFRIYKNKVDVPNGGYGVIMLANTATSASPGLLYNNFISLEGTSTSYGIASQDNNYNNYYYNNVSIKSSKTASRPVWLDATASGLGHIKMLDNIFSNTGAGRAIEVTANAISASYLSSSDYNDLYTGNANVGSWNGSTYSFANYQTNSGMEAHSVNIIPKYTSTTDLHVGNPSMKVGTPISGITDDIDGQTRSLTKPVIGADEFTIADDAGIDTITSPYAGACSGKTSVVAVIKSYGSSTLTSATVNWTVNGTAQTSYSFTGSVSSGSTKSITIGNYTFNSGTSYTVKIWTTSPNGNVDADATNDTSLVTFTPALNGAYTIGGASPSYATFSAAVTDLTTIGVCGAVTFNVRSGTYNEKVHITGIPGSSTSNKITFQSQVADSSKVILSQASSPSATNNYTLQLDSASNITFKQITIQRTGASSNGVVVEIKNKSCNNTFTESRFTGVKALSLVPEKSIIYSGSDQDTGNIISGNLFKYGSYGIYMSGTDAANIEQGTIIKGNTIDSAYGTGILLLWESAPSVTQNSITDISSKTGNGIFMDSCVNGATALKNIINMPKGGYGIYATYTIGTSAKNSLIANNFITVSGTGTSYGIYSTEDNKTNYYYNSILVNNTNSSSSAGYFDAPTTSGTINVKNNNFVNKGGGYATNIESTTLVTGDYNDLYTSGSSIGNYNGTDYSNLAAWQTGASMDAHSVSVDPSYTSSSDLHASAAGIDGKATPIATVKDDIDGQTRNATTPDIGADEFTSVPPDAGIASIDSPATPMCAATKNVIVTLKNFGTVVLNSVTIDWSLNGTAQTPYSWTGTLNAGSTASITLGTASFASGSNKLKVYTTNPNSTTDGKTSNDTATKTITTNALPAANAGSSTTICSGASVKIGAATVSGSTYSWSSNPSGYSSSSANPSVSPSTTTVYTVLETNSSGCSKSNSVTITVNPVPSASTGSASTICSGTSAAIGATSVVGSTYSWTSNPSGFTSTTSNPSVSPTTTTTYKLTETITATGCSKSDSVKITVNPLPTVGVASASTICAGASAFIGATAVSGHTYSWTSSPTGFTSTSANPSVSPSSTTSYTLKETITATGCFNSNSVTVTVTPVPSAPVASNNGPLCAGQKLNLGASTTSGATYAWTGANSFSSSSQNPSISSTTTADSGTYNVTITVSGCTSAAGTTFAKISALPSATVIGNKTICVGQSVSIGGTTTSGDTYAWTSNPSGYTNTTSNPSVSPSSTITYYLTEKVTASGCANSDSVTITVNPVPSATVGSPATICNGTSTGIGSTAVVGNTYSWTSNPSGFTSSTSNPSVSPSVTTTYTLTEKAGSGCSKTDSVKITVNPLPSATVGSAKSICNGSSTSIGASSTSGHTYSWTSNPTGFTSSSANPSVNPSTTTTYTLTETITATGCSKSDSVKITVNPLPTASVGSPSTVCKGTSASIGTTSPGGRTFSWTSNPSGFTSSSANPSVSPTVTTMYKLTETMTSTGCSNSDSVKVTVNPLPSASAGSASTICSGNSVSIGAASVSGSTYSWTSNPSGFTSSGSNPSVSPTVTTTYKLTETITATGCSKSDSVKITVNPLPAANVGSSTTICTSTSTVIGASSVSGHTYSWTSNPTGFTSSSANPTVTPASTTTYKLTETITATGCSNTDSVKITVSSAPSTPSPSSNSPVCAGQSINLNTATVSGATYAWTGPNSFSSSSQNPSISSATSANAGTYSVKVIISGCTSAAGTTSVTVNPLPTPTAGSATAICNGNSTSIGGSSTSGHTYSWSSNPSGYSSSSSNPTVVPSTTTTYKVTETITATGCSNSDSVKITVNPLPAASVGSATAICTGSSTLIGASSVSGHTYSWTSNPSGYTSTSANPTVSPVTTTTYKLTEKITATGCTKSDSVKITVNPLPVSSVGSATAICNGSSTIIGSTSVSGHTYSWISNPGGFTSSTSNPSVAPSVNTTYKLTETITATGCSRTDSVKVTVNPLPTPGVGSVSTICNGSATTVGATAVAGHTYSWTSNPSGFTSTSSKPSVSPSVTTEYKLTETITATGCSNSDSVKITVNPVPSTPTASSNSPVCAGQTINLSTGAVTGATYAWSGPNTFTSSAQKPNITSSASVNAGSYSVTVTVSGCTSAAGSTSVTVNPLPTPGVGSASLICIGQSSSIGAASVSGHTYSWTSDPSGFTSTASTSSVTPATNTEYILTETITATGCSNTDSVKVSVNPLPTATVGSPKSVCALTPTVIGGTAVAGNTYSWTSNPSGYTSSGSQPTVSPAVTTTYILTETVSSGCSKTDSVKITTSPAPSATVGSATSVCKGTSTTIGASSTVGHTYSWTSNPSGFTSSASNPSVAPLVNTYYKLTETITATGCTKSDSVLVSVNPLPSATVGSAQTICSGDSVQIGGASTAGHTYSWTSKTSTTFSVSNPWASPFNTNTYYLTETITATGCKKSDSVVVTVNPVPSRPSFATNNGPLCTGDSLKLTAGTVAGATYKWTGDNGKIYNVQNAKAGNVTLADTGFYGVQSIVGGCYSAYRYTKVNIHTRPTPSITGLTTVCGLYTQKYAAGTTTNNYIWKVTGGTIVSGASSDTVTIKWNSSGSGSVKLIETNSNSCNDSITTSITINTAPTVGIASASSVCNGTSVFIGATTVGGRAYSWTSNPSGYTSTSANPSVSPSVTTVYRLTETMTSTGCSNTDSVKITVNPLPTPGVGSATAVCKGSSTTIGLSAVSGHTYSWTSNPAGYTSTTSNPSVSPSVATVYKLTETITATGCSKSDTVRVSVNPLPSATVGSAKTICSGDSVQIGGASTAGHTYSWTSKTGTTFSVSNPYASPFNTNTYYLTETITATGCSKSDSVVVTVNPTPSRPSFATNNSALCTGDSLKFTAGTVAGATYKWTGDNGKIYNVQNPKVGNVTLADTGFYGVQSIVSGCSSAYRYTHVNIHTRPAPSITGTKTVCGTSMQKYAAGTTTNNYNWKVTGGTILSGGSSDTVTIQWNASGSASVKLIETNSNSCNDSTTTSITINTAPTVGIASASSVCSGSSTSIGATTVGGRAYSWTSNPSGYTSTSANPSVSPSVTTVYRLTETMTSTGCSNTDSVKITVNPLPTPGVGSATAVCKGSSTTIGLSAVSGHTYSWTSNPAGYTSTTSNPSVSPTVATVYKLTETITATGCSKSDTVRVSVNPLPSATVGSPQTICSGDSVQIGGASTTGHTYSWTSKTGTTFNVSNPYASPFNTNTYYLTETITATGCSKSDSVKVTVNPVPSRPSFATNNGSLCTGDSLKLTAGTVAGATYKWTGDNGKIYNVQNPKVGNVTLADTGFYGVQAIVSGCSSAYRYTHVTIHTRPTASITGTTTLCGASTQQYVAGTSTNSHSWKVTGGTIVSGASSDTVTIKWNASGSGSVKLIETNANGCNDSTTQTITINAAPTVGIASASSVCSGSSTSIGAASVAGRTYSWTSNPSGYTSSSANPSVSPATTTVYRLIETMTSTGCSNTDSVKITVNALPTASAGKDTNVCKGSSVTVGASSTTGHTYSWTSSPSGFTSTASNPSVSPTVNTTYIVSETITSTGCNKIDSVNVKVNALPSASVAGNQTICSGDSVQIGAAAVAGDTYSWTSKSGTTFNVSDPYASPFKTNTYYLTETISATGCSKSDSVVVTVNARPSRPATASNNGPLCTGDSLKLTSATVAGATYSWTSANGFTSSSQNPTKANVTMADTGYYNVTVSLGGCSSLPRSTYVTITKRTSPKIVGGITSACVGSSSVYAAGDTSSLNSYNWIVTGGYISKGLWTDTVTVVWHTPGAGSIKLREGNGNGCVDSTTLAVTVNALPLTNAGSSQTICQGTFVTLGTKRHSGSTYSWVSKPAGFTDTSANPVVSPPVTLKGTKYILTETTAAGCSAMDSLTINVNAAPTPSFIASSTICAGATVVYQTSNTPGSSFKWSGTNATIISGGTSDSATVTWGSAGLAIVQVMEQNSSGCKDSFIDTMTIIGLPKPTVAGINSVCINAIDGYKVKGGVGSTYSWKAFGGTINSGAGTDSISVTWVSSGAGYVQVTETNSTGCSHDTTYTVIVHSQPTPAIIGNTQACTGTGRIYQTANNAGSSYKWTISGGTISYGSTTDSINANWGATGTGNLQVTETNASGCSDSASAIVNINALPTPSIIGSASSCANSFAIYKTANDAGASYIWTVNGGSVTAGGSTDSILVNWSLGSTGSIGVVETNASGCSDSAKLSVTLNAAPVPNFNATVVCLGNATQFTDSSSAHVSQVWYFGDADTAVTTNASHIYGRPGTFSAKLVIMNANGCINAVSKTVTVDSLSNAHYTVSNNGYYYTFLAEDSTRPASTYTWDFGDSSPVVHGAKVKHNFAKNKIYVVKLTTVNPSGCDNTVDSSLSIYNGIETQLPYVFNMNIYPNPFKEFTTLQFELSKASHVKISIFALDGREIATLANSKQDVGTHQYKFNPDEYNAVQGAYIMRIIVDDQFTTRQIIRVK